jgi:hypothetical protein
MINSTIPINYTITNVSFTLFWKVKSDKEVSALRQIVKSFASSIFVSLFSELFVLPIPLVLLDVAHRLLVLHVSELLFPLVLLDSQLDNRSSHLLLSSNFFRLKKSSRLTQF